MNLEEKIAEVTRAAARLRRGDPLKKQMREDISQLRFVAQFEEELERIRRAVA